MLVEGGDPGIDNFASGTVILNGNSSVTGNTAAVRGGGIFNSGTLTLNDSSSVTGNTAGVNGGGIFNIGTATLNGSSSVTGNHPNNCVGVTGCTG